MKNKIFIILAVILASCRNGSQNDFIDIGSVECVSLRADSLGLSGRLMAPKKIFTSAGYIALFESKDTEGFLHFYTADGQYSGRYGVTGKARGEYVSPNVFANGEALVIVSMDGTYEEIRYDSGSAAESGRGTVTNKALAAGVNFIALTSEEGLVFESASSEDMLVLQNADGSMSAVNHYPVKIAEKIDPFLKKNVISSCSYAISYSRDTLFAAFRNYPSAGFLSLSDGRWLCTGLETMESNEYRLKEGVPYYEDPVLFYTYAASSGKYFYALFQNSVKEEMASPGRVSEIHCFSTDGRILKRYVFDRRVYHFSVTEDGSKVYALGLDADYEPEVYVYNL